LGVGEGRIVGKELLILQSRGGAEDRIGQEKSAHF